MAIVPFSLAVIIEEIMSQNVHDLDHDHYNGAMSNVNMIMPTAYSGFYWMAIVTVAIAVAIGEIIKKNVKSKKFGLENEFEEVEKWVYIIRLRICESIMKLFQNFNCPPTYENEQS